MQVCIAERQPLEQSFIKARSVANGRNTSKQRQAKANPRRVKRQKQAYFLATATLLSLSLFLCLCTSTVRVVTLTTELNKVCHGGCRLATASGYLQAWLSTTFYPTPCYASDHLSLADTAFRSLALVVWMRENTALPNVAEAQPIGHTVHAEGPKVQVHQVGRVSVPRRLLSCNAVQTEIRVRQCCRSTTYELTCDVVRRIKFSQCYTFKMFLIKLIGYLKRKNVHQ